MKTILSLNEAVNRRAPSAKRVIRALMPKELQSKFAAKKFTQTIEDEDYAKSFANIHSKNWWGSQESVSGYGSQLNRTVWIKAAGIRSIFDAPCGDYNWMGGVVQSANIRYLGGDIVSDVVKSDNARFAAENVNFVIFDILQDTLPETDAWCCRDVLFHSPMTRLRRF